jgi:hypothetical protein
MKEHGSATKLIVENKTKEGFEMSGTNQRTILEQFLRNKLHHVHWSFLKNNCAMLFEMETKFVNFSPTSKPTNIFILTIIKSSCHGYVSKTLNLIFVNHFSSDGIESIFTSGVMFISSSMKTWHMATLILKRGHSPCFDLPCEFFVFLF